MLKLREYFEIFIGVVLISISLAKFYLPQNLVTGGVTGIAVIFYKLGDIIFGFPIPLWVTNFAINLPLLILSYKIIGKDIFLKTAFASLMLTATLSVTSLIPDTDLDLTISVVFGGVLIGIGTALIFRNGATSGGTILLSTIIQRYFKHIKVTTIILMIDVSVIVLGMVLFGIITGLYAVASVFIFTKVADAVISGLRKAKAAFILSQKSPEISKALFESINRGITAIPVKGAYSGIQKDMLLCIMNQRELVKAKEIIKEIDPNAFVIVTSANEVLGKGFHELE